MSSRWIRLVLAVSLPALAGAWIAAQWASAHAEEAAAPAKVPAPAAEAKSAEPAKPVSPEVADLHARVRALELQVGLLQEAMLRVQGRLDSLKEDHDKLAVVVQTLREPKPAAGKERPLEPIPAADKPLTPLAAARATLVVHNQTTTGRYIWVNMDRYYVGPFEKRSIDVPEGTLQYRLDDELPKQITLGAQAGWSREVSIVPRAW